MRTNKPYEMNARLRTEENKPKVRVRSISVTQTLLYRIILYLSLIGFIYMTIKVIAWASGL